MPSGGVRSGAGRNPGSEMSKAALRRVGLEVGQFNLQPNYGQKKSNQLVNDLSVPDNEQRLLDLKPGIQTALRLFARGRTLEFISKEMGVSIPTIRNWRDRFTQACVDASWEIVEPGEVLRPLLPKAVQTYDKLLDRDDEPAVQSTIARDVMDRLFGKPVQRQQIEAVQPVTVEFIDLEASVVPGGQN